MCKREKTKKTLLPIFLVFLKKKSFFFWKKFPYRKIPFKKIPLKQIVVYEDKWMKIVHKSKRKKKMEIMTYWKAYLY